MRKHSDIYEYHPGFHELKMRGTAHEMGMLDLVVKELQRAQERFGPFNSAHEGYAVILEELDELWDEIKGNNGERQLEEAIQVAAMTLRFLLDIGPQTAQKREQEHSEE